MSSWISISESSDFSLQNLPYGIFSTKSQSKRRIGVAIGDSVLDLKFLSLEGIFDGLGFEQSTLQSSTLNAYAGLGKKVHRAVRIKLQQLLKVDTSLGSELRDHPTRREKAIVPLTDVTMHLPMEIGDYTDFLIGLYHATNSASILKGATLEEFAPPFFQIPQAYNGRASSIVVSGTSFRRPHGQIRVNGELQYLPCRKMDYEVEFALFIGEGNERGTTIGVEEAEDHIFGVVLFNDWSARDIQFAEVAPCGPFNGKNFCNTISPWIVPLEALESFRTKPRASPRKLSSYLTQKREDSAYDIPIKATLEVASDRYHIATSNTNNVVFSLAQMVAHHASAGTPLRPGDLIATGTLSGPEQAEAASFFELSYNGEKPFKMTADTPGKGTISRGYMEDGDTIEFSASLPSPDGVGRIGFGTCRAINWGYGEVQMRAAGELKTKMETEVKAQINVIYSWLEDRLGEYEYFNGSTFGWADVCVAPVLNRSVFFNIGPESRSQLAKWFTRVQQRESIRPTLAEMLEAARGLGPALKKVFVDSEPGTAGRQNRDHMLEWMLKSGGLQILPDGLKQDNIRFAWPSPAQQPLHGSIA